MLHPFKHLLLQAGGRIPGLAALSELVSKARGIPVMLESLTRLESLVSEVQTWKESAAKTFLLRNSSHSLLEVICLFTTVPFLDVNNYMICE